MKIRRRIEIVTLSELTISFARLAEAPMVAWCPVCHSQVRMLTANEAARLADISSRRIYVWIENGGVHFTESADWLLLICADSLTAQLRTPLEISS